MLGDNLQRARKEKGMSQEELALKANVVRQTISKWEKGFSVPDAQMLMRLAEILGVEIEKLLGINNKSEMILEDVTKKLARLNIELAEIHKMEEHNKKVNSIRGILLGLAFLSMLFSLKFYNQRIGIALSAATLIIMIGVLYFNLELLTLVSTRNIKLRTLRIYTVFNLFVLIVSFGFIFMNQKGSIDFRKEKLFGIFIVIALMLVTGLMADRLPFNRHTGLRLPWLVSDEGSWNLAHRILKIITVPMILLYITGIVLGFESEALSVFIVLMWIRIPSVLSFIYFCRKVRFEK